MDTLVYIAQAIGFIVLAFIALFALAMLFGELEDDGFEYEFDDFYDLVSHLHLQRDFSLRTFGPGMRTAGLIDHIKKELAEVEEDPSDLMEWIDLMMLSMDGAWRAGHEPEEICEALDEKLKRNKRRVWPDWRTADPNKAIEHVRHAGKSA